jgi:hypothetical protein
MIYSIIYLLLGIPFTIVWSIGSKPRTQRGKPLTFYKHFLYFLLNWIAWPFFTAIYIKAIYRGILNKSRCAWCGSTFDKTDAALKAHLRICKKHPGNLAINRLERENKLLRGRIGLLPLTEDEQVEIAYQISVIARSAFEDMKKHEALCRGDSRR